MAARRMYQRIVDHAGKTGDPARWHTFDHPHPAEVSNAIAAGELYLAQIGTALAGGVVLNGRGEDEYSRIPWKVAAGEDQVLIVHLLGVDPEYARRGVARFLLRGAESTARNLGLRAVRLETFVDNLPARALYESYGFADIGSSVLNYPGIGPQEVQLFELPL